MGLNRQDKAAVIEEVKGIVAQSASIVIAEYRGLSVEAVTKLRAEARKNNVTLRDRCRAQCSFPCRDRFPSGLRRSKYTQRHIWRRRIRSVIFP